MTPRTPDRPSWHTILASMLGAVLLQCLACVPSPPPRMLRGFVPPEEELVRPEGLPVMYRWMVAPDLVAAHWLGARVNGKELVEPLNVVFVDRASATPEEACQTLAKALADGGFPSRRGHTGGYFAFVDGSLRTQLPAEPDHAFSDEPFELPNDHGRVFGPIPWKGRHLFVASFSREGIAPLDKVKHRYVSFNRARDAVADRLDRGASYTRRGFVDLKNYLAQDPAHTTGDHDGLAVLLEHR